MNKKQKKSTKKIIIIVGVVLLVLVSIFIINLFIDEDSDSASERVDVTAEPEIICTSNIYGCEDFSTQAESQEVLEYCRTETIKDIHFLDIDADGVACETLP